MFNQYLSFSDGVKFAIISRNIVAGIGFTTDFSFWGTSLFGTGGISPGVPYLMSLFMKLFGINDQAVIIFSFFFYLALILFTFLLGRKLFSNLVGLLAAIALAANLNFIDYATSGASETLFTSQIVLALYFLSFKKPWLNLLGFLVLGLMYFTRPQAFIFIGGIFLFWLIYRLGLKKGGLIFLGFGLIGLLFDKYIIYPLSFKYPLTPIFMRGLQSVLTYSNSNAVSDSLRGGSISSLTTSDIFKKVFYNLYNFYKALPVIASPYMWGLFIIGLFTKTKDNLQNSFKHGTIFIVMVTFLVTSLTIPFYRYLHPVVPLVYILACATLVSIANKLINKKYVIICCLVLISIFTIGQTVGYFLLDSRFEAKRINPNKPPVYAVLSYKLKEVTSSDEVILTNLDTWGSWYGERKTVWFPLTPKMLLESKNNFDVIYLTSYKIDDENYYMGEEWRIMFNNPKNQKILTNYKFVSEYNFSASENREKQDAHAVLLRKKSIE